MVSKRATGKKHTHTNTSDMRWEGEERTSLSMPGSKPPFTRGSTLKDPRARLITYLVIVLVVSIAITIGIVRIVNGYWIWASEEKRQEVQVERTVAAVGKLILLPENEAPLVATIVDATTLEQEQAFYRGAENGDQLLIYGNSLRAILYSPERNIIVNVGPVEVPNEGSTVAQAPEDSNVDEEAPLPQAEVLTIDIRNGSGEDGAASELAAALDEEEGYLVQSVTDAARTDYRATTIINQTNGEKEALVSIFVERIGGTVSTILPSDEAESDADIIVIIGESSVEPR